ncbi:MAG TPA: TOBE-like domain-containing protein [Longimicrobiales bacterium]|nr:TOBE-like domain-containing protein [Longimicrobiales bacterium]
MSISLRGIRKRFGDFTALDDVSLEVRTGELVALLGPSGSGKTTLLRIIAGLERPDPGAGEVRFHDRDVGDTHVSRRKVGFVFQHYALFRHMTVFENVAFGLRVKPRRERPPEREIRRRVGELLELVQLSGLASRYPHQLSGGQRQRVALARALPVEPEVLLLDEPFGALDARVRKELRAWLRRLHREIRVTTVFVTHDQDEALEVADRVVVMRDGRIEQIGTPEEVFHAPRTEFVMRFLGDVNAFHGRLEGGKVKVGDLEFPHSDPAARTNGSAPVFVRPHDVTIDLHRGSLPALEARVTRVHAAGPVVRVELRTEAGQHLTSEISLERFATMPLEPGRRVYVRARHIRVFVDGASRPSVEVRHADGRAGAFRPEDVEEEAMSGFMEGASAGTGRGAAKGGTTPALAVAHLRNVAMGPDIVAYLERIDETLKPFGGRFLVHGGPIEALEGSWSGDLIIIQFPDRERALAWYRSSAYQEILALRTDNAEGEVIVVDTVPADHRATNVLRPSRG